MIDLPDSVKSLFVAAGWRPGRQVTLRTLAPVHHPAASILSEFRGLNVGRVGLGGEQCGRSNVAFGKQSPSEAPEIKLWSELLGSQLICVATVHNDHEELYADTLGRYFGSSMIHDAFYFHGASFTEAMEQLLLGRRARPMLRPDQETVDLYGETFTANHPSVYAWSAA
jgi:hypothetical protein